MEYFFFILCFLLAKSTFKSYKLLTKLTQTSKLMYKKYFGLYKVKKFQHINGLFLQMPSKVQLQTVKYCLIV